jgi:uncharacterized protein (DUF1501 family)
MSRHDLDRALRGACAPSRRDFVGGLARGLLGVTAAHALAPALPALPGSRVLARPRARANQVIYLFMRGGMSHIDTLDPKPGASTQGPFEAIATRADGVQLGQHLSLLAQQMDKACVIRSLSSKQGAHQQAQYLMRTSFDKRGTIQHPSLGAWSNRMLGRQNSTLPGHVVIGGGADMPTAGFFPPEFAALPIGSAQAGLQNATLPDGIDETRFARRLQRLQQMNDAFAEAHPKRAVRAYGDMYADAVRLMRSSDLDAFDISKEPEEIAAAYGADESFGAGCLLARRLCEHGVRYVEVVANGWDTHSDNFDRLADLLPPVDRAVASLLADLDARGMLRETLVVLAPEFGRTPDIDGDQGRNHYPKAFSCMLAGGGIQGGRAYGSTDDEGREVTDDPVTIQDVNATIAHQLGIDLEERVVSPTGRPFQIADKGEPIHAILS